MKFSRLLLLMAAMSPVTVADAAIYTFSGQDADGIGSARMDFNITGNLLSIDLDNTSPLTLISGPGGNAPGITAFGFDLDSPIPALVRWSLTAVDPLDGMRKPIGGTGASNPLWFLGTTDDGVTLDFLPDTINGMRGAVYNEQAYPTLSALFGAVPFLSEAQLRMEFATSPGLAAGPDDPYVRMQNVGAGGQGSLKLFGDEQPSSMPEPASLAVWVALGLIGSVSCRQRRVRLA